MIHQFIFAGPRPGWVAERFQQYWLHTHAIHYASKIRQIRQYLVAPRIRLPGLAREVPFFEGVAEIWIRNAAEQLESLQSEEFLKGARLDEPNWAAFWQTFVHESVSEVTLGESSPAASLFKIYLFLKRRAGLDLAAFHDELRGSVKDRAHALPGISRHLLAPARDELYGLGEPRFDAIEVLGFPEQRQCLKALGSDSWQELTRRVINMVDSRYFFVFTGRDNWIIRPGERP